MDNTFEKLTEILRNGILAAMDEDNRYLYTDVVDYMMAHGVTLDNQVSSNKWIPVTERLPETNYKTMVIVCVDGKKSAARWFERTTIRGKLVERFKYPWDVITCENITHWMPLPSTEGLE